MIFSFLLWKITRNLRKRKVQETGFKFSFQNLVKEYPFKITASLGGSKVTYGYLHRSVLIMISAGICPRMIKHMDKTMSSLYFLYTICPFSSFRFRLSRRLNGSEDHFYRRAQHPIVVSLTRLTVQALVFIGEKEVLVSRTFVR